MCLQWICYVMYLTHQSYSQCTPLTRCSTANTLYYVYCIHYTYIFYIILVIGNNMLLKKILGVLFICIRERNSFNFQQSNKKCKEFGMPCFSERRRRIEGVGFEPTGS